MRCDQAPFNDARVRQAIALSLNRPEIVAALFKGDADLGNDSPFAPVFPSTNTSVPQRAGRRQGEVTTVGRRSSERLLRNPDRRDLPGDPAVRADRPAVSQGHRRQPEAEHRGAAEVLRQLPVRHLRLAGRNHEPGRLRTPQRAERVPDRAAADDQREDGHRLVERRPLQQLATTTGSRTSTSRRPTCPARRPSPGRSRRCCSTETPIIYGYFYNYLTAQRQERDRRLPHGDRPHLPLQLQEELTSREARPSSHRPPGPRTRRPVAALPVRP